MNISALFILYLIIGINGIIIELNQPYQNRSLNLPMMIMYIIIWPMLLIMDRRNLYASFVSVDHQEQSRPGEKRGRDQW